MDDILFNSEGMILVNGDVAADIADNQLIADIIIASPGHYKSSPIIGANASQYLNSPVNPQTIKRNIKVALSSDVFPNARVDISDFPEIKINEERLI